MNHVLRMLFFAAVVRPIMLLILGLNVRHRNRLPRHGPAVIAANHNSHLDALALISLFPLRLLPRIRPVAAADYFTRHALIRWFATQIVGIIPLSRSLRPSEGDPLAPISAAIARGQIILLFPEGTRGEPERLQQFKTGIAHLAKRHPEVPVLPVYIHGTGKALPRGEGLLVPFFVDIVIGEPLPWSGDRQVYMESLQCRMTRLAAEGDFPPWE